MPDTSRLRALVSRLNGAPPPRKGKLPFRDSCKNRRVLLVLLSGASNLGGYTICRAAGLSSGTVHPFLARLESVAWVDSTWGPYLGDSGLRRRLYHLTRKGRIKAEDLLGLEVRAAPPAKMPAPVADGLPGGCCD